MPNCLSSLGLFLTQTKLADNSFKISMQSVASLVFAQLHNRVDNIRAASEMPDTAKQI